ncbi:MAG: glycosyltransferase [Gemmataceae bacterium]
MVAIREDGRRPRLVLLAYACSPSRGSEGGVGWNRALQAARFCDTHVICQDGPMGDEIREHLARNGPIPGLQFSYIPKTAPVRFLMRFPGLYYAGLNLWHRRAFETAARLHADAPFDLAHLANLCTYREPGYLWKLGIPHVWGPWGGTNDFPRRFLGEAGFTGAAVEVARSFVNRLQFRLSPRIRRSAASGPVLVTNALAQDDFSRVHRLPSTLTPCNGIARVADRSREWSGTGRPLRILWSGELRPIKALPLLLKALAAIPAHVPWEARVLGQGRSRAGWQRLARRLGVNDRITWCGWLAHSEAVRQFDWADVFAFTSLRDTFPTVLLEALAAGTPVVCLDHHGMRDIVTPECGIKIPMTTPERVIADLSDSLAGMAGDPARWNALSRGAVERARLFLWSRLGDEMGSIYRQLLAPPTVSESPHEVLS